MTSSRRRNRLRWLAWLVIAAIVVLAVYASRDAVRGLLFDLTGEENLFSQIKGLTDLSADLLRPRVDLAPEAPVRHVNLNPFGVNVFLNEEVEPAKREQTVRLAKEAGFYWLRQEFPWQDIEIHGKGDFEDRRNPPARSAWDKYDQIVALADRYDMELIVRVSTPPAWSRARGDEVGTFAPPDNYDDFGDFVYALVDRYKGRIRFYQLWNEPNIYPEWGVYPISPEDYTRLLKIGATRAREADPNVVIIAGALASTIELSPDAPPPGNALNDLLFLQRMYDSGAAPYFDIMAMQAYGLWSGPTDRRMHPRVMNFGRPQFVRDVMVANGDATKPIWISEMGWNTVPADAPDQRFGRVTPEQQARYTPLAYQRSQAEWSWAGVVNTWYFKRATDEWLQAKRPEGYFRLADPDFTLQPVYGSLKAYMTSVTPVLYPGMHEAYGWAVTENGDWESVPALQSPYGSVRTASTGSTLGFVFSGTALWVTPGCGDGARCDGSLQVTVDEREPVIVADTAPAGTALADTADAGTTGATTIVRGLKDGEHSVRIQVAGGPAGEPAGGRAGIAAITVRRETPLWERWAVPAVVVLALLALLASEVIRRMGMRRRESQEPPPPPPSDEPPVYPRRRLWRGVKQ